MGDDRLQRARERDEANNTGAKIFKDSVHGVMKFPKLVVKFIATKEFQRLSNIKQLSTLYMVFPAAAHNRFEHSLGVCHLAGELLTHLQQNSPGVWNWIFDSESEGERVKLAVQLAGLLHDLGHGPFSHTWEKFVHSRGEKWDHEDSAGDLLDLIIWGDSNKTQLTEVGEAFEKEFLDVDKYLQLIKHLISGKRGLDLVNKDYGLEKKRAFIYQVVANKVNDVDVDKFDYFLRDAQHLNMGIAFDYQRLMNHCRIEIKNDTTSFIAFRDCEAYNLQALFRTRADIHIRACQHRVHVCLEKMLIDAMTLADKSDFKVGNKILSRVHEDPRSFVELTDSILEKVLYSSEPNFEKARRILNRMLTRKLYDVVGEWVLNVEQSDEEKRMNKPPSALKPEDLNELEEQLSSTCAVSQVAINQGGYYDPMKNIKYYPKHGRKGSYSDPPLIKIDLPYYKVYVFKKEKDDNNSTEVIKQIVKNFLELKRVYREETSTASTSQKRPRSPDPDLPRRTSLPHGAGPSHMGSDPGPVPPASRPHRCTSHCHCSCEQ